MKLLDFGIAKLLDEDGADGALTRTELPAADAGVRAPGAGARRAGDHGHRRLRARRRALRAAGRPPAPHRFERHTPAERYRSLEVDPQPPSGPRRRRGARLAATSTPSSSRRCRRTRPAATPRSRRCSTTCGGTEHGPAGARPARLGRAIARASSCSGTASAVAAGGAGASSRSSAGLGATLWQARVAAREAARAGIVRDFVVGLFEVAYPHRARGRPVTALDMLELGGERAQTELVREPAAQAELLHILSAIYRDLGQYDQALPLIRKSTEISVRTYGPDHLFVAQRKLTWGRILYYMADYAAADSLLSEVVTAYLRLKGPRHPETSTALLNLAYVRNATADYASAEALQREALDIDRAWYGDDDLATAWDVSNLGETLLKEGKVREADSVHTEALRVRRRQLDANHDELMISVNNLGLVRTPQGRARGGGAAAAGGGGEAAALVPRRPPPAGGDAEQSRGGCCWRPDGPRRAESLLAEARVDAGDVPRSGPPGDVRGRGPCGARRSSSRAGRGGRGPAAADGRRAGARVRGRPSGDGDGSGRSRRGSCGRRASRGGGLLATARARDSPGPAGWEPPAGRPHDGCTGSLARCRGIEAQVGSPADRTQAPTTT